MGVCVCVRAIASAIHQEMRKTVKNVCVHVMRHTFGTVDVQVSSEYARVYIFKCASRPKRYIHRVDAKCLRENVDNDKADMANVFAFTA